MYCYFNIPINIYIYANRIRQDIVADLPTIYEMPSEAVAWVDKMIQYTVAGGKMNRGLSLMAVQKTLSDAKGRALTNKVSHNIIKVSPMVLILDNHWLGTCSIGCTGVVCGIFASIFSCS